MNRNKNTLRKILTIFFALFPFISLINLCQASDKHLYPEKFYQLKWCNSHNGHPEFILQDKTRCDCLTDEYAIEFDFGDKWAEAIGQAMHYSLLSGKKPGIVLIIENKSDIRNWLKLNVVIDHYRLPIKTWRTDDK